MQEYITPITIEDVLLSAGAGGRRYFTRIGGRNPLPASMEPSDVFQTACEEVWRNRDRIRGTQDGGNPKSVFIRNIINRGNDATRRIAVRKETSLETALRNNPDIQLDDMLQGKEQRDVADEVVAKEARKELAQSLLLAMDEQRISPFNRKLLLGRYYFDESYDELITILAGEYASLGEKDPLSVGIVKSRLHHARQRLAQSKIFQGARDNYRS